MEAPLQPDSNRSVLDYFIRRAQDQAGPQGMMLNSMGSTLNRPIGSSPAAPAITRQRFQTIVSGIEARSTQGLFRRNVCLQQIYGSVRWEVASVVLRHQYIAD